MKLCFEEGRRRRGIGLFPGDLGLGTNDLGLHRLDIGGQLVNRHRLKILEFGGLFLRVQIVVKHGAKTNKNTPLRQEKPDWDKFPCNY